MAAEKKNLSCLNKYYVQALLLAKNVHEAICAQPKKDFINKLEIAQKVANETLYWIKLLLDSEYIAEDHFKKLNENCTELKRILTSIILPTKQKYLTVQTI